jgi:hypothetical protein
MAQSSKHGTGTSGTEATNISNHDIWLYHNDKEYFLSFDTFPWFREARIADILHVTEPSPGRFHWPDLDVDLNIEIIEHPEKYPLTSKER